MNFALLAFQTIVIHSLTPPSMATVLGSEGEVADMLDKKCVTVLHFTASFSKHCETVSAALGALATQHGALRVYQVSCTRCSSYTTSSPEGLPGKLH